jgi:hypothetical protein
MEDYVPLGSELTLEEALIQASQALDISAMLAQRQGDTKALQKTAMQWVKLADFMAAYAQTRDEPKEKTPFGFTAPEKGDEAVNLNPDFFTLTEVADDEQLEIEFEEEDDVRDDED